MAGLTTFTSDRTNQNTDTEPRWDDGDMDRERHRRGVTIGRSESGADAWTQRLVYKIEKPPAGAWSRSLSGYGNDFRFVDLAGQTRIWDVGSDTATPANGERSTVRDVLRAQYDGVLSSSDDGGPQYIAL